MDLLSFTLCVSTFLVGLLWPAYATFCAIESPGSQEYSQWRAYWPLFWLGLALEAFLWPVLNRLGSLYYAIKAAVLVWLILPQTQGAMRLHDMAVAYRGGPGGAARTAGTRSNGTGGNIPAHLRNSGIISTSKGGGLTGPGQLRPPNPDAATPGTHKCSVTPRQTEEAVAKRKRALAQERREAEARQRALEDATAEFASRMKEQTQHCSFRDTLAAVLHMQFGARLSGMSEAQIRDVLDLNKVGPAARRDVSIEDEARVKAVWEVLHDAARPQTVHDAIAAVANHR